jgi:hypothetical protein
MTDQIPAELLHTARNFVTAVSLTKLDADGLPLRDPAEGHGFDLTSRLASKLVEPLHGTTGAAHQVWVLADMWLRVQTAIKGGHTEPDLGPRWRAAVAQAPDLMPDRPIDVPDDVSGLDP